MIVAAHQQLTHAWWSVRHEWELSISALVIEEAKAADADAAKRRLNRLEGLSILHMTDLALDLSTRLIADGALPEKAKEDAVHVALAAAHGMDYLLTWNCKHIANATKRTLIERICQSASCAPPIICTPEELLGDRNVD
ncbi:PIN domain-containing protein [Thiorhodovibrio winogradskyi]|uniref:hypothetical protein n=1 Tax=Thiorhodovibrio winogradskyi TaxID=77007 RepID=UPI002E2B8D13|nr:hypothetical protein [Thiorhodovibrio winogradskyi]